MTTKKLFEKLFQLNSDKARFDVFRDTVTMIACAINNIFDIYDVIEREERYTKTVENYDRESLDLMIQAFLSIAEDIEEDPRDVLGELYTELEISKDHMGQYFTPSSLSRVTARMAISGQTDDIKAKIKDQGYISVYEPACGSGSFVVGLAEALKEEDINYQEGLFVIAQDLDLLAVYMCYIQLSIMGIPAVVIWGDTLEGEVKEEWKTPFYYLKGMGIKLRAKDDDFDFKTKVEEDGQITLV